ncbi:hypothetical protein ruthe_00949 [Rubellimicrobium thermophilum DSM 16684]|uniref:DUF502 domain-containing protein n=1 Tax=Rubellimicrobium thermophilum DSM 16684 TaxID=1123069 RepID=S9S7J4_9RHOB|nr:DUF502 domain-containing protein [Rubellimicrobium thermophilum]EPX86140.1 hypothetical protein ruthe_00949 [Rubellimicrobium thermophilum DSM 16684]
MTAPAKPPRPRHWLITRIASAIRNNFFAGVVVIAPLGLTVWLIWTAVGWVDGFVMPFVPRYWHPDAMINRWLGNPRGSPEWIDVNIRGVGVVVFLIFTVLIGWMAKGLIGRSLLRAGEEILGRVPVVRSVYNAVKQIAETLISNSEVKFEKACLVQFPRKDCWTIAFITAPAKGELRERLSDGEDDPWVCLFRPNTPNATTGYLFFVRRSEIIELDMTLEDAAKLVISAGLVYPGEMPRGTLRNGEGV